MSKSLKGSQTEKNILTAFAGESQARNRYTFFASVATKEGLMQIAEIFTETANQEKEHAKRFWSFLEGGMLETTPTFPAGASAKTLDNLKAAADGEHEEWTDLYPEFAKIAREEGFEAVAKCFENISIAEKQHEKRYAALAANIQNNKVFRREESTVWRCRNCGFIVEANEAPVACPACAHPKAYFEILGENY